MHLAGHVRYWLKHRYVKTTIHCCYGCDLFFRTFDLPVGQMIAHFEEGTYTCLKNEDASRQARHSLFITILHYLSTKDEHPRILDVGCGYGHFLNLCHAEGWEAYGLEIGHVLYQHLLSKKPYKVIQSPLHQAQLHDGFFDIITFIDSLYYVDDPRLPLTTAHRKLRQGGTLLLRVTNRNAYIRLYLAYLKLKRLLYRGVSSELPEWLIGDSTWMFSQRCLRKLLKATGFSKVKFHYWERGKARRGWAVNILYLLTWAMAKMSFGVVSLTPGLIVTAEKVL